MTIDMVLVAALLLATIQAAMSLAEDTKIQLQCVKKFNVANRQISASSSWNSNHGPANAKLHHKAGGGRTGAWSAKTNDVNQWLRVDLGQISKITAVATQGRAESNQWVTTYTLEYSLYGIVFAQYKEDNVVKVFRGNGDRNTVVGHKLSRPIVARYVRFRPRTWYRHISLRMAVYGCTSGFEVPKGKCVIPLGLQSHGILDSQMSASSEFNSAHRAANARLHFRAGSGRTGSWSARYNNANQWLQVDFQKVVRIDKVATQGRQDYSQWVTSYGISYSQDGILWKDLPVFAGNKDRHSVVAHSITPPIDARYVRIMPKTWRGHISMRAEFYGCDADIKIAPPTCQSGLALKDNQLSASSSWNNNHGPANAKLHHKAGGGRTGAWSAKTNDVNQWLRVDLGQISKITAVATRGRADSNQWVKTYTLEYSLYGIVFAQYKEDNVVKVFRGNGDRNTVVGHKLSRPIVARYVRFRPRTWYRHISMRMAVYGCTSGFEVPKGKCVIPLGLQSHGILDSQMSASSEFNSAHRAANARLHFRAGSGRTGSWSARYNNANQWLQVDFQKVVRIDKVATQGRQDYSQWVTSYGISYSQDGILWKDLPVFAGNKDRHSVVAHSITPPIDARYVRIMPKTWRGHISMRAEFYGCDADIKIAPPTCQSGLALKDNQLSASSSWNSNHGPANAKLHHKAGGGRTGAWSAKTNDVNQWLRVDLGQISKITAVATQGRAESNQWVTTYTLEYSLYGIVFAQYKEDNVVKVFRGNGDRNTVVGHKLSRPIVARYVRFRPRTWYRHISMRMAVYGCTSGFEVPKGKCVIPLGLQSHGILDSQMSASSEFNSAHRAANARLHFRAGSGRTGSWSARYNNANQWLQVDFQKVVRIDKVATQGRQDYSQWVTSYGISYSQDGILWKDLPVFAGNKDRHSVVAHSITPPIDARYVRIMPKTWRGHISMRAEFYGCDADIKIAPPTCQSGLALKDNQLSASSSWNNNHGPANAKLHHKAGGGRTGAWSAKTNDVNQWLRVDLGQISKITAVATRGRADSNQWVKTYTLEYSLYGIVFAQYKEDNVVKVFRGNGDRNTVVGHKLSRPIVARYVRFRPSTWYRHISMRMAVYGCTSGFEVPKSKCAIPLGLQSHGIRDSQMSASSEFNSAHRAANARLHFRAGSGRTGSWSARYNNANQWLQVDFQKVVRIDKVATQGRQDYSQWVTSYGISYSQDGILWKDLPVFAGNKDRHSVVAHSITPPIDARYVRIMPKTWRGHISMRAEFYGCDADIKIAPPTCQSGLALKDNQLSASSSWNNNHGPANAKLHHKAGGGRTGAWSAKTNDVNQWLRVDLGQISKITAVATRGRADSNQWVKTYTLEYSLYGIVFAQYKEDNVVKVFRGNGDRNTVVGHKLSRPIVARYVRFRPRTWYRHISMRMAVYGCTSGFEVPKGKCAIPLGLQSHGIRDSQMSASSEFNSAHRAANARLHFRAGSGRTGSWSARYNNANQWLQVDFQKVVRIDKVATQGRQDYSQWVTSYGISYSQDGILWKDLPVFAGNKDRHSVVAHSITPPIDARYVRIMPKTWRGHISMRVEFYGCDGDIKVAPTTCQSGLALKDNQLSASSSWNNNHGPVNAKLHHKAGGGRTGAWSAKTNDVNQWLQVDLGQIRKITAVATRGRADSNQWVKTYTLDYSLYGTVFTEFNEDNAVKVFRGNGDRNTVVSHKLCRAIVARYVRFRPRTWYGHISMRIAVYGCKSEYASRAG